MVNEQERPPWLEVELDLDVEGLVITLDQDRFRRVVINVIDNAVQAMEPQAAGETSRPRERLTVRCRRASERLVVTIRDTGPAYRKRCSPACSSRCSARRPILYLLSEIVARSQDSLPLKHRSPRGTHETASTLNERWPPQSLHRRPRGMDRAERWGHLSGLIGENWGWTLLFHRDEPT